MIFLLLFVELKFSFRNCRFYLKKKKKDSQFLLKKSERVIRGIFRSRWLVGFSGFPDIPCFSKAWIRLSIVPVSWPCMATRGTPSTKTFLHGSLCLFLGVRYLTRGLKRSGKVSGVLESLSYLPDLSAVYINLG